MQIQASSSNEEECVQGLRELLSLVVSNTKKEMTGKKGNTDKEQKLLVRHLTTILGRKPSELILKAVRYS